jgi:tRNA U34 5-methylaminomethyl-2-thiouridine-forming methyltransferase MnmC
LERKVELITTSDGSHSLYLPEMNETYHSSHGALTESKHIFIQAGLQHYLNTHPVDALKILEVGFGTGLNALLALQFALADQTALKYVTLEPFPLPISVYSKLNYPDLFKSDMSEEQFMALHKADWGQEVMLNDYFILEKRKEPLEDYQSDDGFNLVFFDAFAPSKQAELWTYDVLQKTVGKMAPSAVLVTYCARGQFKRDLAALGLTVETLPGPPGKKEMVRATTK